VMALTQPVALFLIIVTGSRNLNELDTAPTVLYPDEFFAIFRPQ